MRMTNPLSEGEYSLMKEEMKRGCTPAVFGFGASLEGKEFPAICLKKPLENRAVYANADIKSKWSLAQNLGVVEAIYLDIEFKNIGNIRICFDESMFCEELARWFRLLIEAEGEFILNDTMDIGELVVISVTGVPLDVPKLVIESIRRINRDSETENNKQGHI